MFDPKSVSNSFVFDRSQKGLFLNMYLHKINLTPQQVSLYSNYLKLALPLSQWNARILSGRANWKEMVSERADFLSFLHTNRLPGWFYMRRYYYAMLLFVARHKSITRVYQKLRSLIRWFPISKMGRASCVETVDSWGIAEQAQHTGYRDKRRKSSHERRTGFARARTDLIRVLVGNFSAEFAFKYPYKGLLRVVFNNWRYSKYGYRPYWGSISTIDDNFKYDARRLASIESICSVSTNAR